MPDSTKPEWDFDNDAVTENVTLKAYWTEIKVTSMTLTPQGGTSESSPFTKNIYAGGYVFPENIYVDSVAPSSALNKNAECIIRSGSSLVQSVDEYGTPVNNIRINFKQSMTGIVKFEIRAEGNPSVVYYYEYTLYT